jgi:hypothetical protein
VAGFGGNVLCFIELEVILWLPGREEKSRF